MLQRRMKALSLVLCTALGLQLGGCGTILYPERRGQAGGRVDTGVAVMDGLWCLAFILPGVIAFIVDFGNGAIYEYDQGYGYGNGHHHGGHRR